jgi:hypothetical protein
MDPLLHGPRIGHVMANALPAEVTMAVGRYVR